jgi:endonuclease/exonuclease/phosphatase family metal-dependent hydrolase
MRILFFLALVVGCAASPEGAPPPASLRLVSYNIKHGLGMDGVLDLERVGDYLAATGADVVLLQEVDDRASRSGGVDQAAALGARLGMTAHFAPFMDFQGGRYGLAILAAPQVVAAEVIALPAGTVEPRSAMVVTLDVGGAPLRVANAHLDWLADDERRVAQARALLEALIVEGRGGPGAPGPVILGGDLNDVPGSTTLALLQGWSAFGRAGPADPTFPADVPDRTIDHFLIAPVGAFPGAKVLVLDEPVISDHRPVQLDVVLGE